MRQIADMAARTFHHFAIVIDKGVEFPGHLGSHGHAPARQPEHDYIAAVCVFFQSPGQQLPGVTSVAAGRFHSLALKSNGTVWAWGSNNRGKLGTGNYSPANAPVQAAGVTGAIAVAAGAFSSFAVQGSGNVLAWGGGGLNGDGTDRER